MALLLHLYFTSIVLMFGYFSPVPYALATTEKYKQLAALKSGMVTKNVSRACTGLPTGGFPMIHHNEIHDQKSVLM